MGGGPHSRAPAVFVVRLAGFLADGREIVLYLSGISVIING